MDKQFWLSVDKATYQKFGTFLHSTYSNAVSIACSGTREKSSEPFKSGYSDDFIRIHGEIVGVAKDGTFYILREELKFLQERRGLDLETQEIADWWT